MKESTQANESKGTGQLTCHWVIFRERRSQQRRNEIRLCLHEKFQPGSSSARVESLYDRQKRWAFTWRQLTRVKYWYAAKSPLLQSCMVTWIRSPRNLHLQCCSNLARDTRRSTFVRFSWPGLISTLPLGGGLKSTRGEISTRVKRNASCKRAIHFVHMAGWNLTRVELNPGWNASCKHSLSQARRRNIRNSSCKKQFQRRKFLVHAHPKRHQQKVYNAHACGQPAARWSYEEPWSSSLVVQDQVPSILRRNLRSYVDNVSE